MWRFILVAVINFMHYYKNTLVCLQIIFCANKKWTQKNIQRSRNHQSLICKKSKCSNDSYLPNYSNFLAVLCSYILFILACLNIFILLLSLWPWMKSRAVSVMFERSLLVTTFNKPFVWCSDSRVALSGVPGLRLLRVPLLYYCVHGNTFSWYPLFSQSFAMGATEYLAV